MDKLQEAILLMQEEAISAAEKRLARKLSGAEQAGIRNINSCMMLEAVCRDFSFEPTARETIEADLAHFASLASNVE